MKKGTLACNALAITMGFVALMLQPSCKKVNQSPVSPWHLRSSGTSLAGRGIVEMSAPNERTCYAVLYGSEGYVQELSITHDGGATWRWQPLSGLEGTYICGVAAFDDNTVHVLSWDFINGGGTVLRSDDGGTTWKREAPNAYTDPASAPATVRFFNSQDGVLIGGPLNGYFEIYTTSNGGSTWSRVPASNIPPPDGDEYSTIYQTDTYKNTIWTFVQVYDSNFVTTLNTRLLQSDDKGLTWYVRNAHVPFEGNDATIKFRNHSVGLYKNNGVLYRTTDGGSTWNVVNYSGTFFTFDFDNIPGQPGSWISAGSGGLEIPEGTRRDGSSISFDDGNHWITLDTAVYHTNVDMTSPVHGYSGGLSSTGGSGGVFVYSFPPVVRNNSKSEE